MPDVMFKRLDPRAKIPTNAYGNDAGWDMYVLQDTLIDGEDLWTEVRSGIAIAVPEGHYARIVGRSSTWRKRSLFVHEGIIDAGYRGELFACVSSGLDGIYKVEGGTAICQIILQKVDPVEFVEVDELPASIRGEKGFGSSGN
jgi:dUTP pyrophosphatase